MSISNTSCMNNYADHEPADFAWWNKFIDTYKLMNANSQVSHLFVSDLKTKAK